MNELIGNTPMIKIWYRYLGEKRALYTKLECVNLTGSIKDRIAYSIIKKAILEEKLLPGMSIVEATSGNTGVSFAALGAYFHNPVIIYMPEWASEERRKLMESYGAQVYLVSKEEGGFLECKKRAHEKAQEIGGYYPDQFSNLENLYAHYETTANEILDKVPEVGGFVSGIGTGGTLMGIGKKLKEKNSKTIVAALEPDKAPLLSCGKVGFHKIEGIGDEFIPDLFDMKQIDQIYLINDDDAVNMARKLARELGLGVGISSGANFLAAVLLEDSLGTNIVTVFPDDQKKYLSTDLINPIDNSDDFLSNQITLLDYEVIE